MREEVTSAAQRLAVHIEKCHELALRRSKDTPKSAHSNRASEMGHPCDRYLVLRRTQGEQAHLVSDDLQSIFDEGRLHEREVKGFLATECDLPVYNTEKSFPPNDYNLTGHQDFETHWEGESIGGEIKSLNDTHWRQIRSWEDIRDHGAYFVRKWYTQAQQYMYLSDLRWWVFVIKNKTTGRRKAIACPRDLDYIERVLDRVERINRYVNTGELPDYLGDPVVCRRCPFFRAPCYPPESFDSAWVSSDPELHAKALEVAKYATYARRYNAARAHLRDLLDMACAGRDRVILLPDVTVTVTYRNNTMRLQVQETERGDVE